jgi:hypothetical protein
MTHMEELYYSSKAVLIRMEHSSLARLKGVVNPIQHPHLWTMFNRYSLHAATAYKILVQRFEGDVQFDDRFTPTQEQYQAALVHYAYGNGSLTDRRNDIVRSIFKIETEKREADNYRKGWEEGAFRKIKEPQLLMPFALYLARLNPVAEEAA